MAFAPSSVLACVEVLASEWRARDPQLSPWRFLFCVTQLAQLAQLMPDVVQLLVLMGLRINFAKSCIVPDLPSLVHFALSSFPVLLCLYLLMLEPSFPHCRTLCAPCLFGLCCYATPAFLAGWIKSTTFHVMSVIGFRMSGVSLQVSAESLYGTAPELWKYLLCPWSGSTEAADRRAAQQIAG